ncbi:MAG: molybdate ABC transporter permease subunit [Chthonomonadales bacterium]|nr:molybdate ABC transporter permease subunit [Chthonomonadales bacterium]
MGEGAPDLSAFWLSLRVAGTAVLLVAPLGALAAWWLAHGRPFRGRLLVEVVLTLPLVLPPTAVGFGLLLLLGHGTAVGRWVNETVGLRLLFTWQGAALAAAVMALPLFVRTAEAAFASVDEELLEAGRTLGVPERALLLHVIVPLSYRGLLAGLALAFARALGEFGATLMVAGSIPGRTQTMPLALYAAVQAGRDRDALLYAALLTCTAFVLLGAVSLYQSRLARGRGER